MESSTKRAQWEGIFWYRVKEEHASGDVFKDCVTFNGRRYTKVMVRPRVGGGREVYFILKGAIVSYLIV
jgi:hypothetical protein